ncbi:MAG TPA: LacI family DNA-binding transcriptional regulator, partial [Solirubrobacteraceae bacterium]|nr:LacI family DNA-binding transcriptional regulator [Solirubrobacteraceae bacterium]
MARRAGVSSAAVSFAMNGRRGVGEATRARILEAADALGWSPSAPARALSRARAGAIGLLLARPVDSLEVDPFFLRFLAGIERGLARTDHALLLRVLDSDGPVDPDAYARLAAQG